MMVDSEMICNERTPKRKYKCMNMKLKESCFFPGLPASPRIRLRGLLYWAWITILSHRVRRFFAPSQVDNSKPKAIHFETNHTKNIHEKYCAVSLFFGSPIFGGKEQVVGFQLLFICLTCWILFSDGKEGQLQYFSSFWGSKVCIK